MTSHFILKDGTIINYDLDRKQIESERFKTVNALIKQAKAMVLANAQANCEHQYTMQTYYNIGGEHFHIVNCTYKKCVKCGKPL